MNKFIYVLTYDDIPEKVFTSYKKVVEYLRKTYSGKEYDHAFKWSCLNLIIDEDILESGFSVHIGYFDDNLLELYCIEVEE